MPLIEFKTIAEAMRAAEPGGMIYVCGDRITSWTSYGPAVTERGITIRCPSCFATITLPVEKAKSMQDQDLITLPCQCSYRASQGKLIDQVKEKIRGELAKIS